MNWLPLIIQLVSGAVGGNAAANFMKDKDLGLVGNSLAGIVGGGIGGQLIGMVAPGLVGGGMDIASIIGSVASGGVGGGILLAIVGFAKSALGK